MGYADMFLKKCKQQKTKKPRCFVTFHPSITLSPPYSPYSVPTKNCIVDTQMVKYQS